MASAIYRGALVMQDGHAPFERRAADILVTDDRITAIADAGTMGFDLAPVIDVTGCLAAAGLVNGHLHSWDHLIKGRVENLPMEVLMAHLRPAMPLVLRERHIYVRTAMAAIESLRSGATTIVDDLSLGQVFDPGHVEAALGAYDDAGLRAYLGFSMIDKPVVDSWPFVEESFAPDVLSWLRGLPRPRGEDLLELVRSLARSRHPSSARVAPIVAPSAPQRCTDDFLKACRALADECDLPMIIHALETRLQAVTAELFWGQSMIEHLAALGVLKPETSLVHGVWLSPKDRALIAESGASVQLNPWSNLSIGSGVGDFHALKDAGINVSMGSDGCGVTFCCSMLQSLKAGAGLGRVRTPVCESWPTAAEWWDAATLGGAKALGREGDLGQLAPGHKADIVFYRLDSMALVPLNVPVRQLVHAETGSGIDTVLVDGNTVMRHGRFTKIDENALIAEFNALHGEMLERIVASEAVSGPVVEGLMRIYNRSLSVPIPADLTAGTIERDLRRVS
jgi:5-methylthioadenosine/S-adenosylhomocysteine deaminase